MTAVYTITSGLHDEASVARLSDAFLGSVFPEGGYVLRGADFSDFGTHGLDLIYVRTGGAEGIFKRLLPDLLARGAERFLLLTSGQSNSLAASWAGNNRKRVKVISVTTGRTRKEPFSLPLT